MAECKEAPIIEEVGPMLHITCPGCRLDRWEVKR